MNLQVYTIDRFTQKLTVVGYATLNIFVEIGVEKQPSTDQGGVQVGGGHLFLSMSIITKSKSFIRFIWHSF